MNIESRMETSEEFCEVIIFIFIIIGRKDVHISSLIRLVLDPHIQMSRIISLPRDLIGQIIELRFRSYTCCNVSYIHFKRLCSRLITEPSDLNCKSVRTIG